MSEADNFQLAAGRDLVTRRAIRLEMLREAAIRIENGTVLSHTYMRRILTAGELREYRQSVDASFPPPSERDRSTLKLYSRLVAEADRLYARASKLSKAGAKAFHQQRVKNRASHLYFHAQEVIVELIATNMGLSHLFDRPVDEEEMTDDPEGMPRLNASRSQFAMCNGESGVHTALKAMQHSAISESLKNLN